MGLSDQLQFIGSLVVGFVAVALSSERPGQSQDVRRRHRGVVLRGLVAGLQGCSLAARKASTAA